MSKATAGISHNDSTGNEKSIFQTSGLRKEELAASSIARNSQHLATSQPYSSFQKRQKWLIILLATFAATFSPLSSFIFFPAVTTLSEALHVSVAKINLTITSYLIIAGIAPAILGDMAETVGRRWVYLLMMSIYCVANIGLAFQSSWITLFILRMLQSAGSAATVALGYGVVSDIATPAERGQYVSGMVLGPNIATAIGPIIGGAFAEYSRWRWIFRLLSILSATCFLLIAFFLPETARSVVGNGSREVSGIHKTISALLHSWHSSKFISTANKTGDGAVSSSPAEGRRKFHIPNPLQSLRLLKAKDCILIVLIFGIFYMNLSCVQASTSTLFVSLYGVSELKAGLFYLPSGIGSILGAYGAGYILKADYQITARKHGIEVDIKNGDDLARFPIEEARLRSVGYSICGAGISTVGYGWALHSRVHMAVPLILQFIIGFSTAMIFNSSGTLLTDLHPKSPSTASAANSIVRCSLAAVGLAVVQILIDGVGVQWTFTLFGAICLGCLGIACLEWKQGPSWRDRMRERGVTR